MPGGPDFKLVAWGQRLGDGGLFMRSFTASLVIPLGALQNARNKIMRRPTSADFPPLHFSVAPMANRLDELSERDLPWYVRLVFAYQKRKYGQVLFPMQGFCRVPPRSPTD